ncbi:MAG: insulinase family protein [Pirellulales bacterium]
MRAYWAERYVPGNITLVAAGKVDFPALVESAKRACGSWKPGPTKRDTPAAKGTHAFEILHKEQANQEYLIGMADAPSAVSRQRFAAKAVAMIVGDDSGSRLYWDMVDPGLAEYASVHYHGYEDAGAFMTYLGCEPEQAESNLRRVHDIFAEVEKSGVTADELKQAQSKFASRIVLGSERPRGRMFVVGGHWMFRHEYRSVQEDLASVRGVTIEDCAELLRHYKLSGGTYCAIGPLKSMSSPWH